MNTRQRLWRWLRAEVNDRLGRKPGRASAAGWRREADEPRPPERSEAEGRLRRAYSALELPYGADLESVRKAYKTLMKRYHPDRFRDDRKRADATELVKRLNEAYALLVAHLEAR